MKNEKNFKILIYLKVRNRFVSEPEIIDPFVSLSIDEKCNLVIFNGYNNYEYSLYSVDSIVFKEYKDNEME